MEISSVLRDLSTKHSEDNFTTMDDTLMLPVSYNGKDYELPFRILMQGYAPRYLVLVDQVEVTFERDDQGELRAVVYNADLVAGKLPDRLLLEAIHSTLEQLVG